MPGMNGMMDGKREAIIKMRHIFIKSLRIVDH